MFLLRLLRKTQTVTLQDFLPKLKDHLIPRLRSAQAQKLTSAETQSNPSYGGDSTNSSLNHSDRDSVYFKSERIYLHKIYRVQYTTYDVRREQDVINPSTPHRDIMLLATTSDNGDDHPFLYARVLGVYHANVIHTADATQNYQPTRFEFLWVRWYKYQGQSVRWRDLKLDVLSLPSVNNEDAFGFVDPGDILRACHIIPAFSGGKKFNDEVGLSRCANDSRDWSRYYVNRLVFVTNLLSLSYYST